MRYSETFTVETFNGHDTAKPARFATFVCLQERGPERESPTMGAWYPPGIQEAMLWDLKRFRVEDRGQVFLHKSGRFFKHPGTTPPRWALWIGGTLDGAWLVAVIDPHLINNAFGKSIRGERALRLRLWLLGWGRVLRLRRRLRKAGYLVFIAGDLNRLRRWWVKLRRAISHHFDWIIYPPAAELVESWTGDPNGSDHAPLFARFRLRAH